MKSTQGFGADIWRAAKMVIDGAVEEAYGIQAPPAQSAICCFRVEKCVEGYEMAFLGFFAYILTNIRPWLVFWYFCTFCTIPAI